MFSFFSAWFFFQSFFFPFFLLLFFFPFLSNGLTKPEIEMCKIRTSKVDRYGTPWNTWSQVSTGSPAHPTLAPPLSSPPISLPEIKRHTSQRHILHWNTTSHKIKRKRKKNNLNEKSKTNLKKLNEKHTHAHTERMFFGYTMRVWTPVWDKVKRH